MNIVKKFIIAVVLISTAASGAVAGGTQEDASMQDARSGAERPLRIVSLAPSITETVFALGKGELIVGRTDYCNFPAEAGKVQSVGPIQQPNIETIISLKPDVVIASTHAPKEAGDLLANAGIKVKFFFEPQTFDDVYDVISQVAAEIGALAEAEALISDMKVRYSRLQSRALGDSRPSVYYVVGFGESGDWTAGGDTFIGAMLETAGGNNIASEIRGWSFSLEKLVESDPDIIIIGEGQKDLFKQTPIYSELSAVKTNRVYGIDEDVISRQGPRLIEGLEILNSVFSAINE
ncbi:MAG: ABC transporter substrate-binding protein [Spirochaetales bacterium]|nr:ABC transporter substrate-binding protein [Spirochaetales bacterium]